MAFLFDPVAEPGKSRAFTFRIKPHSMSLFLASFLLAFPATAISMQSGQTSATRSSQTIVTSHKHRDHRHAVHHRRYVAVTAKEAVIVAPPPPLPPAQQPAQPASVQLKQQNLGIQADNSSLIEILHQVSSRTGMVIDGLGHDKRIYGKYGPGPITSVLAQLLDGSGYNYIILNGSGNSPSKLMLTASGSVSAGTAPAPVMPAPIGQPASPVMANPSEPVHPKTPQQIFEELRRMHPQH